MSLANGDDDSDGGSDGGGDGGNGSDGDLIETVLSGVRGLGHAEEVECGRGGGGGGVGGFGGFGGGGGGRGRSPTWPFKALSGPYKALMALIRPCGAL